MDEVIYSFCFKGINNISLEAKGKTKIAQLLVNYFYKIQKPNLLINNIDNTYFIFNGSKIDIYDYNKRICDFFFLPSGNIIYAINSYNNKYEFKIIKTIKDNIYTAVYEAQIMNQLSLGKVAVKKIFKDKIKEEMILVKCKAEITEEDFRPEVEKFNKEIQNMQKCSCENSVKIYDYYDTEKEFIIIMELCDETLFHALARTPNGFSAKQIKSILLQLNNAFKKMNYYNITHRDIKSNNILIKYMNKEKTRVKVLLSDYGVSNHLCSLTQKFMTHAGTQLIMAPEILNNEKYDNKCDLWSLGITIYQLHTKTFPYLSTVEKGILDMIQEKGQTVLNVIKDYYLKDLLSKLLVRDPRYRISWEEYFEHPFFK